MVNLSKTFLFISLLLLNLGKTQTQIAVEEIDTEILAAENT